MKKIAVIGDSHSRVLSNTDGFTAFFLGPGSSFNLYRHHQRIAKELPLVLKKISNEFDYIIILFGEPTCRWQIKKDNHIHKKNYLPPATVDETVLNSSTQNYFKIIELAQELLKDKLVVLAPIVVYNPAVPFTRKFNELVGSFCNNNSIHFIDINPGIRQGDEVPESLKGDPIHANQKVVPLILDQMKEKDLLSDIKFVQTSHKSVAKIKSEFIYNKQFGCYVRKGN